MVIRTGAGSFKCHFRIFVYLEKNFYHDQGTIMASWQGDSPLLLCYQLELVAHFFMRDRSYQWLKDATSFGLISDKSTEIQGSEYWENCQFSILATWPT